VPVVEVKGRGVAERVGELANSQEASKGDAESGIKVRLVYVGGVVRKGVEEDEEDVVGDGKALFPCRLAVEMLDTADRAI
jgi:hypothetical protein